MPVVKVNPPSTIRVRVGTGITPRVSALNSAINTLSHLNDVNMTSAVDGSVVVYNANTNTFTVEDFTTSIRDVDAGYF